MEVLREQSPVLYQSPTWIVPLVGWQVRITITTVKAFFAITQIVRMLTMAALAVPIPYTFDPSMYGISFRKLGLPDKASFSMDLAFRFMPTLGRDFSITTDAQRARGYDLDSAKGGIFARIGRMAPLIVPVTMQSIVTGEEVVDAMDLRAFGVKPRSWLKDLHYQRRDYWLIGLGVFIMAAAFTLSLLGYGDFWVPEAFLQLGH
jgi:energy-coupling factor transport system permease protein